MKYGLLALDLDGTTLDPRGDLTRAVHDAVARARRAGMRVVLSTGRRYRTALPLAHALEIEDPMVVNNGVLVKTVATGETIHEAFLPTEIYAEVLAAMGTLGPPLVYIDAYHEGTDMITEEASRAHPYQQEYLADNTEFCRFVDDLGKARPAEVIMMSVMADEASLGPLRERASERFGDRVYTHSIANKNYRGHILEFLSPAAGKWTALCKLAASLGFAPEEIAAVGDDVNDAGMIRGAGLGIAMGNAIDAVKEVADRVVGTNAAGGAVEAIDLVLAEA